MINLSRTLQTGSVCRIIVMHERLICRHNTTVLSSNIMWWATGCADWLRVRARYNKKHCFARVFFSRVLCSNKQTVCIRSGQEVEGRSGWQVFDDSTLERRTRDRKVSVSRPGRIGGRIFFSRVSFLCWFLFRFPFHSSVTAAARNWQILTRKSVRLKCKWQNIAKHTCTYVSGFE